jgi:hypothetical protein
VIHPSRLFRPTAPWHPLLHCRRLERSGRVSSVKSAGRFGLCRSAAPRLHQAFNSHLLQLLPTPPRTTRSPSVSKLVQGIASLTTENWISALQVYAVQQIPHDSVGFVLLLHALISAQTVSDVVRIMHHIGFIGAVAILGRAYCGLQQSAQRHVACTRKTCLRPRCKHTGPEQVKSGSVATLTKSLQGCC